MAFQFPAAPAVDQVFSPVPGLFYKWNGQIWIPVTTTVIVPFRKNAFINGDMTIAQRGTSFAAAASGTYSADRWVYRKAGTVVHTVSQDVDVPTVAEAGRLFTNSLKLTLTTPDTAIAAADFTLLEQIIEGYNFRPLAQRIITLSFWFKSPIVGVHCAALRNIVFDRSCVKEFTVNAINTWEKKVLTFPASPVGGTWNYTNDMGLRVTFGFAVGSNFHTAPDVWQTGNFFGTANQVNGVNTGITPYLITGLQLEPGNLPTEFEQSTIQEELALCQRYFYLIGGDGGSAEMAGVGQAYATTQALVVVPYPVTMRANSVFSTPDATLWRLRIASGGTTGVLSITGGGSPKNASLTVTVGSVLVAGNATWLDGGSAAARLLFSAEFL